MNKKLIITFIFSIIFFKGVGFGNSGTIIKEIEVPDLAQSIENLNDGKISVEFCNPQNEKETAGNLNLGIKQGETKDICLLLKNHTHNIIAINMAIVGATESKDKPGTYMCNLKTENNEITNFFDNKFNNTIYIQPNSSIKKETKITFPFGKEGINVGCIEYQIKKDQQVGGMINFKFRKILKMKFMVLSKELGTNGNNISIQNTKTFKSTEGKLHIKGKIENKGVLNETINIHGTISNIFGFHKEFEIKNIKVTVGQSAEFNTENIEINSFLPTYGGLFNIKLDINYKPYFDFDVSNLDIDEEIKKGGIITINKTYFQVPRLVLGGLILIIILLFLAFRKPKQKVVYVQQPQQPTPNT